MQDGYSQDHGHIIFDINFHVQVFVGILYRYNVYIYNI